MTTGITHLEARAIKYLNYRGEVTPDQLDLVRKAIEGMKRIARPQFVFRYLSLVRDDEGRFITDAPVNIGFSSLQKLFENKNSDSLCILVSTLGPVIDKRISESADEDPAGMILLDACANAYIEEVTNDFQRRLNLGEETFRFAPGYGDVPLSVQREIFDFMPEIAGIGIRLDENNLMHPMKSMTGFIGFRGQ